MKRTLLLILIITAPLFTLAQLDSLKGPVKQVHDTIVYTDPAGGLTIYHREYDFGQYGLNDETMLSEFKDYNLFRKWQSNKTYWYNRDGKLSRTIEYNSHYKSVYTSEFNYDEYNNLAQQKNISGWPGEDDYITVSGFQYRYLADSQDHVIAEIEYSSTPGHFSMKQYFYNDKAQLIEERSSSGARFGLDSRTNYSYDSAGHMMAEVYSTIKYKTRFDQSINAETVVDSVDAYYRTDWKYSSAGLLLEKSRGCASGLVKAACSRIKYSYDQQQRVSAIYYYWMGLDSLFSHREYEYYPDGNLKKIKWFSHRGTHTKNEVEYFYDRKELAKLIFTRDGKSSIIEFKYQLDAHNNWIEQSKIIDGKLTYTRKRLITYWD